MNHPSEKHSGERYLPRLIAWEVTRSCNLACIHCRASAKYGPYPGELSLEICYQLLDDIASFSNPIIILTGGEPLMRKDIFEIASYGNQKGLRMVMAPNGTLITKEIARKMKEAGIARVSISLDGASAESHDRFRQVSGAFEGALRGIGFLKEAGIEFQINTTITQDNIHEIEDIQKLALELGAVAHHPFLLVPTGRAADLKGREISPQAYEETLHWFCQRREEIPMQIKVTCAPHYYRILRQEAKARGQTVNFETYGLDAITKGCLGGQAFAFISHTGKVQICGYLETECGDVKKEPFSKIWATSKVFQEMRNLDGYKGRCGYCEYRKVCGGCRARAFGMTGDYLEEEPFCTFVPRAKVRSES